MRLMIYLFVTCLAMLSACRKSEVINTNTEVKLSFSSDTVLFDTVFTAVGSTNKRIKVYNDYAQAINISNIRLSGGSSSNFSLIVNGQALNEKSNLKIGAKDSISIFIKVLINPNNQSLPFIVQDSILFHTNGNAQSVQLLAYGQNAIFINDQVITGYTSWTSQLPYIIYKSVTVAPNVTLRIQPGTKVLFHSQAGMRVRGSLQVEGTVERPVLFAGDRMENYYAEEAGQWNGIHLLSSSNSSAIQHATIKNAIIGVRADSLGAGGSLKLLLNNTMIKNMSIAAVVGYGTKLAAFNNLFYNCGQYLFYGGAGGDYDLKHNTFAGYNPEFGRRNPAVYLSDAASGYPPGNLKVSFVNNIVWGTQTEEFLIDKKGSAAVGLDLRNNLMRTAAQTYMGNGNLLNTDPLFENAIRSDFSLATGSPAYRKGANLTTDLYYPQYLSKDFYKINRSVPSTLGCYE